MSESKKYTILYVEDQPDSAALIERILKAFGYKIVVRNNGHDGIGAAIEHKPDLILLDLDLPDISGFEVAMRLRELGDFRRTPIIALTSQDSEDYRSLARVAEISSYLTKPINVEKLSKKIEQYLRADDLLIDINLDPEKQFFDRETIQHLVHKIRELEASNEELRSNNRELVEQLVERLRDAEAHNAELRRLDHAKDDFIQRVAHEIRTPLTVIMGYFNVLELSEPMKDLKEASPEIRLYLEAVDGGFERMHKVVDEIVMISRLATGKVEISVVPIVPYDLVSAAIRPFRDAIEQRGLILDINIPTGELPILYGDVDLLSLALINLVGNAIKYTPDGGNVVVSVNASEDEKILRFIVQDTGIGIDPEQQHRIFDRFYSADDVSLHSTSKTAFRGGGLGLGLAITKAVVETHGGHIYVESHGQDEEALPGSIFYVEIPVHSDVTINRKNLYESFN